jgi:thiol-disulfide isomerase/thioredoxin
MRASAATLTLVALCLGSAPRAAWADRTQVFSLQGADGGDRGAEAEAEVKKVKGVKKASFDARKVELTVRLADGVGDDVVIAAVARTGLTAVAGAGQGTYVPHEAYPAGADFVVLSKAGEAVGPLPKRRVPGKYTVFDLYADWCGPCRLVDTRLREIVAARPDVAVRKLNVVDFDTPLAREMGPGFDALPYVVVFTPSGKRVEITGIDFPKLDKALRAP